MPDVLNDRLDARGSSGGVNRYGMTGCKAILNSNQSVASGSFVTAISFSGVETNYESSWWSGANPTRITPTDGYYEIVGYLEFAANATGVRGMLLRRSNGSRSIIREGTSSGSINHKICGETHMQISGGQYFELYPMQTSGGNLNVVKAWLFVKRLPE